jgi:sugar transferase EpsL
MSRSKRCLDIVGSLSALALLFWPLVIIAFLVRLKLGAPVIFKQARPGKKSRTFLLNKFRTMVDLYDGNGRPLPDADRLTSLGRFLRKWSLDELPELWNVIKGDMSLVGPRPLLMEYLDRYTPEQARRHEVKPGITGWAQVNGRNAITWEQKFRLDIWYIDNISFWIDLKIIAITMTKIIKREGISQLGQATMEEFIGSAPEQDKGEHVNSYFMGTSG